MLEGIVFVEWMDGRQKFETDFLKDIGMMKTINDNQNERLNVGCTYGNSLYEGGVYVV